MQITITGARGSGKTTLAAVLIKYLSELGLDVRVHAYNYEATRALYRHSEEIDPANAITHRQVVHIVDSLDTVDEDKARIAPKI